MTLEQREKRRIAQREWYRVNNCCAACGVSEKEKILTIDHIIPTKKGGKNVISNIQPLCHSCNASKRQRSIRFLPNAQKTILNIKGGEKYLLKGIRILNQATI